MPARDPRRGPTCWRPGHTAPPRPAPRLRSRHPPPGPGRRAAARPRDVSGAWRPNRRSSTRWRPGHTAPPPPCSRRPPRAPGPSPAPSRCAHPWRPSSSPRASRHRPRDRTAPPRPAAPLHSHPRRRAPGRTATGSAWRARARWPGRRREPRCCSRACSAPPSRVRHSRPGPPRPAPVPTAAARRRSPGPARDCWPEPSGRWRPHRAPRPHRRSGSGSSCSLPGSAPARSSAGWRWNSREPPPSSRRRPRFPSPGHTAPTRPARCAPRPSPPGPGPCHWAAGWPCARFADGGARR